MRRTPDEILKRISQCHWVPEEELREALSIAVTERDIARERLGLALHALDIFAEHMRDMSQKEMAASVLDLIEKLNGRKAPT